MSSAREPAMLAPTEESPRLIQRLFRDAVPMLLAGALLDLAYWRWVEPDTRLRWMLAMRAVMIASYGLFGWVIALRNERDAIRAMWAMGVIDAGCFAAMTHASGGLRSLYPLALLVLAIGAASAARPRRESYAVQFSTWSAFGLFFALFCAVNPAVITQWSEPRARGMFLFMYGFMALATAFSCELSYMLWTLRREVFESKRVGQYVLRKRIGHGGMGEVWSAWHVALRREVAVKFLHGQMSDSFARKRFEREARATASLEHPNTVRILDAGVSESGQPYYAMELLSGESLRALVDAGGPLSQARAARLIAQAARALGEAHKRAIVHRDVKPENLFVCAPGEREWCKVLDFGIAKVIEENEGESKLSSTGWLAGTPAYMAPEVVTGEVASSESDVYALGAALYFALTGEPPFVGEHASAVLFAHVSKPVQPPSERLGSAIDPSLESLVIQCLHKERERRPRDGDALADQLDALGALSTDAPAGAVVELEPTRGAATVRDPRDARE